MRFATVLVTAAAGLISACDGHGDSKALFESDIIVKSLIPTSIEIFKSELKKLPPMTMAEVRSYPRWADLSIPGNSTNECNECLLVALRHPDLIRPLGELPGERPFGNTDGDSWNQLPDGSPDEKANEILDGWGNPIAYIRNTAYGQPVTIVRGDGTRVEVHAVKTPGGAYYNRDSYQVISLGEDGVQSDDDRENFTRVAE